LPAGETTPAGLIVRFGSLAKVRLALRSVRFVPKAGLHHLPPVCRSRPRRNAPGLDAYLQIPWVGTTIRTHIQSVDILDQEKPIVRDRAMNERIKWF
jgi:hypothetical protein